MSQTIGNAIFAANTLPMVKNTYGGVIRGVYYKFGGERGIRTPVGVFDPQTDFESVPLRPLRYLSFSLFISTAPRR